jgi:hypothetical protein
MTTQDLITSSLRLLGVIAAGETPATEDLSDGLTTLNQMLDSWNSQHLTVYSIVNRTKVLSAGVGSYTMGTGGAIDFARPVKIESANIIQSNGLSGTLELITSREWAAIEERGLSGVRPLKLYNNDDYPLTKLFLWPIPSGTPTLDLWVWEELSNALALIDTIDFAPAYMKAIRYNLAVDLAPEYGREPSGTVMQIAGNAKAEIFGLNASNFAGTQDPPAAPPAQGR